MALVYRIWSRCRNRRSDRRARPADDRLYITTLAAGIAGALVGGLIGQAVLGHKVRFGWDWQPFALAVIGSIVLLFALEALTGRRRRPWG
ncbi:MAG: GlsB/YeaQ/YmgE family stress response membrane protein [Gaiellaceae bacterium]